MSLFPINEFIRFLDTDIKKHGPLREEECHVIFKHGTVIRFDPLDVKYQGFKKDDDCSTWDREYGDINTISKENTNIFKRTVNIETSVENWKQIIETAYVILKDDEYPRFDAPSITIPALYDDKKACTLFLSKFVNRSAHIFNICNPTAHIRANVKNTTLYLQQIANQNCKISNLLY